NLVNKVIHLIDFALKIVAINKKLQVEKCFNLNKHFEHVMINYILIGFINLDKHFKHVMLIYMFIGFTNLDIKLIYMSMILFSPRMISVYIFYIRLSVLTSNYNIWANIILIDLEEDANIPDKINMNLKAKGIKRAKYLDTIQIMEG
ncbi:hypothetical protein ACJX0J_019356, partial [Zea mays]